MKQVDVSVVSYQQLFDKKKKLIIPEYQRPYVWNVQKCEELLGDFLEYFSKSNPTSPYYLGSILYYYNQRENRYEIIDGQQRITTLLIIQSLMSQKALPDYQSIEYNGVQSKCHIQRAAGYFRQQIGKLESLNSARLLDHLSFTLIITHSEDDAFTFFDTQNTRGVKLNSTDFLKAYHLRAISSENQQERCARNWEKAGNKVKEGPFLSHLFDKILWRARNWKGQSELQFEKNDLILDSFQKRTITSEVKNGYPLYPNFYNRQSAEHIYENDGRLTKVPLKSGKAKKTYPYSLRQPLYKGLNFFAYTEKYCEIYHILFEEPQPKEEEIINLRTFYNDVYTLDMSSYLRHFMQLCLVIYYDVFGQQNLLKAAYCIDYFIGALRLEKQQIKREAITKSLRDDMPNNLLDIIANAYLPSEVFDFVYNIPKIDDMYHQEYIEMDHGVRGRYMGRVLRYFNKNEENLIERKEWGRI